MKPTAPDADYTQVACSMGPAQWNKASGALLVDVQGITIDAGDINVDTTMLGETVDAPVADSTTKESATARTGVSLWKRAVNVLIDILAKLPTVGTAGTSSANVLSVQGIASGTVLPVYSSLSLKAVSDPITLGATATLQSLAAAVMGLKRVVIIPSATAVGYYAYNKAASASTAPLSVYAFDRPINATDYALVQLYGTAGTVVIEQYS